MKFVKQNMEKWGRSTVNIVDYLVINLSFIFPPSYLRLGGDNLFTIH